MLNLHSFNKYRFGVSLTGIAFFTLLLGVGCGSTPGSDIGGQDTNVGDEGGDTSVDQPEIVFTNPTPGERALVSGTYKAKIKYSDPKSQSATLTVTILGQDGYVPYDIPVGGPGNYDITIDTKKLTEGNKSIRISVATLDGREAVAQGKILIDNLAPEIQVLEPTPLDGSNFMDDLVMRFKITDAGNKVHNASVTIGDFEWVWPKTAADTPVTELDTRKTVGSGVGETYEDIVVSTAGWTGGDKVVTVTADDGDAGHETVYTLTLRFVEVPGFVAGESAPMPEGTNVSAISGIRVGLASDKIWAVAVNDTKGVFVYKRVRAGVLELVSTVITEPSVKIHVADMNRDLMDDLIVYHLKETEKIVTIFVQTVGPDQEMQFEEFVSIPIGYELTDIATGDLNGDNFPDIAITTTSSVYSTSMIMSQTDENEDLQTWGEEQSYSGAVNPERVVIGKFTGNGRNAVLVGKRGSGVVTVFPMDENGLPTSGENNTLDPENGSIKGISAMASVNFQAINDAPNSLVYMDSEGDDVVGVAIAEPLIFYRVVSGLPFKSGIDPQDLAVGDINADGTVDFAVLCSGANMVQVYNGLSNKPFITEGASLLSGAGKDLTLADMDEDGFLDIVLLNREGNGLMTIFYRSETGRNRFIGSYQTRVGFSPQSIATGHFVAPFEGVGQSYLDAVALVRDDANKYSVKVFASDLVTGMPISAVGSVAVDVPRPNKLAVGNFDVHLAAASVAAYTRPDDLIVTSMEQAINEESLTAQTIMFHEISHSTVSSTPTLFFAGNEPAVAAVADFDRTTGGGKYDVLDVAFLSRVRQTDAVSAEWLIRPLLGYINEAEHSFVQKTFGGAVIPSLRLSDSNQPSSLLAFPLRRALGAYVTGSAGDNDLITANAGTGDFMVFLSKGLGVFLSKEEDVKSYAVGGSPVDVKAGYTRSPIDGSADVDAATNELPDVVVLLNNDVVISYSLDKEVLSLTGKPIGFESPVALGYPGNNPIALDLKDMNGDGFVDIVVLDKDQSMVWIYVNLAQRKFSAPYSFSTGATPVEMSVADLDGDGCLDIVTADSTGKTMTSLRNTASACKR
jgi:hypothetical protein